jgi:cell division protease FtsH
VEIPQAIRDRAASNGNGTAPDDSDAGAVLTPPGAGGDIHGGPIGPGPTTPEPPAPA